MLVLAQAVQLLALVRGEALLQPVVAVADRGVEARSRPPEVGALLGEEFRGVVGAEEADEALGVDLDGQRADGQLPPPVLDLDGGLGRGRLVEQRARQALQDRPAEPGPDPDRVGAPRLDAYGLLSAAPLQGAVAFAERADGGGGLGEAGGPLAGLTGLTGLSGVVFGRLIHVGCS